MATINPAYRLEVTAPDSATTTAVLVPGKIHVSGSLNEGAMLTATELAHHVGWLVNEDSATNPLQLNSYVTLKRARYTGSAINWSSIDPIFRGRVRYKGLMFDTGGNPHIGFHAESKLAFLKRTLASINGYSVGTLETPSQVLTAVTLKRIINTGLPEFAYFPDRTSDAWLPTTFRPVATTLDTGISATDTTIIGTTTNGGFTPSGMILVGTEWIYYNGYQNDGSGGKYRFLNCTRGVLGSTAASALAGVAIKQVKPNRMSPRRPFYLEKQVTADSSWIPLGDAFTAMDQNGGFQFDYDIMGFSGDEGPFNADPRATYAVYEEDSSSRISVGSVIQQLLEESQGVGGPGWIETTDFTIDSDLDDLTLVRFQIDEPTNTLDAIQQVFALIGLQLGDVDNGVCITEDPTSGVVNVGLMRQVTDATAADVQVAGTIGRSDSWSMDDIYSGVEVAYEEIRKPNLLAPSRSWHPALNDVVGTGTAVAKKIIWRDIPNHMEKADAGLGWQRENSTTSNTQRSERIFNDNPNQAWGIQLDQGFGDTIGPADVMIAWFGNVTAGLPANAPVDRVYAMMDLGWTNHDIEPVHVQILALTGSGIDVTTDPPTYHTTNNVSFIASPLEVRFRNEPDDYGNMRRFQELVLEAEDVGLNMRGIVVRYQGMPTRKDLANDGDGTARRTAAIVKLRVEGPRNSTVKVQTTAGSTGTATSTGTTTLVDTAATFQTDELKAGMVIRNTSDGSKGGGVITVVNSQTSVTHTTLTGGSGNDWQIGDAYEVHMDATYLYAPATHAKLRDVNTGEPAIATINIGQNTRETAIAIGRLYLINSLLLINTYEVTVTLASDIPQLGLETVEVTDAGAFNSTTGQFTTGVLRGLAQSYDLNIVPNEGETLRLVLRDYQGGLLQ